MIDSIKPARIYEQYVHYWWMVVLFTLLGAIIGRGVGAFKQPFYESTAEISASIDFTRTGTLTDIEQDLVFVTLGDVISSTPVAEDVISKLKGSGSGMELAAFRENSFLERKDQTWVMRVRSTNPQVAMQLVNIWAETATQHIEKGYKHALAAEQYNRYLDSLSSCLGQLTTIEPANGICQPDNLAGLQVELKKTGELAVAEQEASLGLSPALKFSLDKRAEISPKPVLFGVNTLIFAGALVGFLIGIIIVQLPGRSAYLPGKQA
jgi:hypothetical protein